MTSIPQTRTDEVRMAWHRYGTDRKLMLFRAGCTPFEVKKFCGYDWPELPYRIQDMLTYQG